MVARHQFTALVAVDQSGQRIHLLVFARYTRRNGVFHALLDAVPDVPRDDRFVYSFVQLTVFIDRSLGYQFAFLHDFCVDLHGTGDKTGIVRVLQDGTGSRGHPFFIERCADLHSVQFVCDFGKAFAGKIHIVDGADHTGLRLNRSKGPAAAVQFVAFIAVRRTSGNVVAFFLGGSRSGPADGGGSCGTLDVT